MRSIDLGNKKVVDRYLDRLDTRGVSRRDFTKLISAGVAAGMAAEAMGVPASAYAAENGKIRKLGRAAAVYCRVGRRERRR